MEEALIELWRNMYMEKKVGSRFLEDYTLQSSFFGLVLQTRKRKVPPTEQREFQKKNKDP